MKPNLLLGIFLTFAFSAYGAALRPGEREYLQAVQCYAAKREYNPFIFEGRSQYDFESYWQYRAGQFAGKLGYGILRVANDETTYAEQYLSDVMTGDAEKVHQILLSCERQTPKNWKSPIEK